MTASPPFEGAVNASTGNFSISKMIHKLETFQLANVHRFRRLHDDDDVEFVPDAPPGKFSVAMWGHVSPRNGGLGCLHFRPAERAPQIPPAARPTGCVAPRGVASRAPAERRCRGPAYLPRATYASTQGCLVARMPRPGWPNTMTVHCTVCSWAWLSEC